MSVELKVGDRYDHCGDDSSESHIVITDSRPDMHGDIAVERHWAGGGWQHDVVDVDLIGPGLSWVPHVEPPKLVEQWMVVDEEHRLLLSRHSRVAAQYECAQHDHGVVRIVPLELNDPARLNGDVARVVWEPDR